MLRRVRLLVVVVAVCFGFTSISVAQEKVQLRLALQPGTSWTFSESQDATMDANIKAAGQQQQVQNKMTRNVSGTAEVLAADPSGRPSSMKLTFDQNSGGQMSQNGQTVPVPVPLAGKTVTVKMENGQFSADQQLDPASQQELKQLFDQDGALFPTQPVGVGESWTVDPQRIAQVWQVDPSKTKIGINLTLKQLRQDQGRQVADIEFVADMSGAMQGMGAGDMTGERHVKGTATIDVATGRSLGGDFTGNMTMSGLQQQQTQTGDVMVMQIDAKGTMTQKSQAQFKNVAAAAPAAAAAAAPVAFNPAPAPNNPAPPVNPLAPAANPLAANANQNPLGGPPALSGTFTSNADQMTLVFMSPGPQMKIKRGNQSFDGVVSKFDGKNFAGSFTTPSGSSFPFTGALDGGNMTFSTGGKDYRLQGEANPLGQ